MKNLAAIFSALVQEIGDLFRSAEEREFDTGWWNFSGNHKRRKPVVAICVGHSRSGDLGARSIVGESEWEFNQPIAYLVAEILERRNIHARVIDVYDGSGYSASMSWLGRHLVELNARLAIEMHFNAAGSDAHGYEYLHWYNSAEGKRLATELADAHAERFPNARRRGVKALTSSSRGSQFVRKTPCPAVICEPFFGSNDDEWRPYANAPGHLAEVYAQGITNFLTR